MTRSEATTPTARAVRRATPDSSTMPVTERILGALPGPRWFWVAAWASVALLRIGALVAVLNVTDPNGAGQASVGSALGQTVFAFLVLATLVGAPVLVRRVSELSPTLEAIAPSEPSAHWFARITNVVGPIVLVVLAVAASLPSTIGDFGVAVALVDVVLLSIVLLPIMTFVWAYGSMLLGFDRLGRAALQLDDFPQDRALGLGPLGSVAMTGFSVLILAAAPVLIFAGSDVTTVATSVTILAVMVVLFVLSMVRLHGQLRVAKGGYVSMTRRLVAEAYGPVRVTTDLATLQANKPALDAALALSDRAEKILEWPIDERMVAWITVVVTGVATGLVVRLIVQAIGA
ncbi:MAG: hypothetical protein ACJ779_05365 [Chloroflexota bacterium]